MSGIHFGDLALRVREPAGESTGAQGALILNHGRGADENDLHPLLDELDPERRLLGVTTGAPITGIPPGGRHWYVVERVGFPQAETFGQSYELLTSTLDSVLAERGIAWSKVVIGGFSQGTVMSYATALGAQRPTPAGLLALSGFIPTVEGWNPHPEDAGDLGVYIHHGANDPVISVEHARAARELLEGAGIEPVYRESNAGHSLPSEILPELREFITTRLAVAA